MEKLLTAVRCHYPHVEVKPPDNICALNQFFFTWAILSGCNHFGYEDRWCYPTEQAARQALAAWSGADGTEPEGWHRHPDTGRRRAADGTIYVMR